MVIKWKTEASPNIYKTRLDLEGWANKLIIVSMKKQTALLTFIYLILSLLIFSCQSELDETDPENPKINYKLLIPAKWYNTTVTIDTYTNESRTTKTGTVVNSSVGFLKIDPKGSYEIVSDDVAEIGAWSIDETKGKLILDDVAVTSVVVEYDIMDLSATGLTVKRAVGNKIYTQRYKSASCPSVVQLTKQWDNTKTFYFYYNSTTNLINNPYLIYPVGYFKLNADLTYNVMSNNVPLNGSWKLGEPYCMLDLDLTKQNQRSFEIVKLTTDSLVIWRKDASAQTAYLQYYLKH